MAFDCNSINRKPLLFSDLFKNHRNTAMEKEQQLDAAISASSASSSSSATQFLSSWDSSSSSGLSTPLHSELCSSEGDSADFIAELTRQMAECMLEEEETAADAADQARISCFRSNTDDSYENSGAVKSGFYWSSVCVGDSTQPNIQIYELKNQLPASKEGSNRRRRVKRSESAQRKQTQKTEHQYKQYRGREWGIGGVARNGYSGSGMQAVFLSGSGSRSGSLGTGVFLPRDPTELKSKTGCSMVLMPTRVLQVLEQHFSKIQQDSIAPPLHIGGDELLTPNGPQDGSPDPEIRPADVDDMQLPQEWTY